MLTCDREIGPQKPDGTVVPSRMSQTLKCSTKEAGEGQRDGEVPAQAVPKQRRHPGTMRTQGLLNSLSFQFSTSSHTTKGITAM